MAILRRVGETKALPVPARMLVGRSAACALRLDDRHVSGEHASLIWTGKRWELRDLGSRNGTFLDGDRLLPGEPRALVVGGRVGFGHEEAPFEVLDVSPPSAVADDLEGGGLKAPGEGGLLALPDEDNPSVVAYQNRVGQWVVEVDDAPARPARDQEVVRVAGHSYRLYVPAQQEGTATLDGGPTIDSISLRFAVSRDEEHVTVTVIHRGLETPLEPREHGYALLTLARHRLEEQELPLAEQGWIDRDALLRMLGMDSNSLNVAIYRARNQLGDSGVEGAAGIVEVRRGQRRIGLEPGRLQVVRL